MTTPKLEDALELSIMCGALSKSLISTEQDQNYFNRSPLSTKAILKDITIYFFNDENPNNWLDKNAFNSLQEKKLVIFKTIGEKIKGKETSIEKGYTFLKKKIINSYQSLQGKYPDTEKLAKNFNLLSDIFDPYN